MKKIFVDTSGWANLVDSRQEFHKETKAIYHLINQENSRLVTTNYIITELVALLTSPLRLPRPTIVNLIHGIKTSSLVDIIHIDKSLDDRTWDLLSNRTDKTWSLVDCSSFGVMQENNISEAGRIYSTFEIRDEYRLLFCHAAVPLYLRRSSASPGRSTKPLRLRRRYATGRPISFLRNIRFPAKSKLAVKIVHGIGQGHPHPITLLSSGFRTFPTVQKPSNSGTPWTKIAPFRDLSRA